MPDDDGTPADTKTDLKEPDNVLSSVDESWTKMFEKFRHFKTIEGHSNATQPFRSDINFVQWIATQRKDYKEMKEGKKSTFTEEQVKLLEELGFAWEEAKEESKEEPKTLLTETFSTEIPSTETPSTVIPSEENPSQKRKADDIATITEENTSSSSSSAEQASAKSPKTTRPKKVGKARKIKKILKNDDQEASHSQKTKKKLTYDQLWKEKYEELQDFKETEGHCRAPKRNCANPSLGNWVVTQRAYYKALQCGKSSKITDERIQKLEDLGFEWEVKTGPPPRKKDESYIKSTKKNPKSEKLWQEQYEELQRFKEKEGHCRAPKRNCINPSLGNWVVTQRYNYRLLKNVRPSMMTNDRITKLEELGFEWEVDNPFGRKKRTCILSTKEGGNKSTKQVYEETWQEWLEELKVFKEEHGHCWVKQDFSSTHYLSKWCQRQREKYKLWRNGKPSPLTQERRIALEELGFEWEAPKGDKLLEKDENMEEVGFECKGLLEDSQHDWEEWLEELKLFKLHEGHCNVELNLPLNHQLVKWSKNQRINFKLWKGGKPSTLTESKRAALKELGFEWELVESEKEKKKWLEMFEELRSFKEKMGHCSVPFSFPENPKLAAWARTQRLQYRLSKEGKPSRMTDVKKTSLEGLGFVWEKQGKAQSNETKWQEMYRELKWYRECKGHCDVPLNGTEHSRLGRWVWSQRSYYKQYKKGQSKSINEDRIQLLEEIGFAWNLGTISKTIDDVWMDRYTKLIEFKALNGHCNVPKSGDNLFLGRWVSEQRRRYKELIAGKPSRMTQKRRQLLEDIGFKWQLVKSPANRQFFRLPANDLLQIQKSLFKSEDLNVEDIDTSQVLKQYDEIPTISWDEMLEELCQFKLIEGHCQVPILYVKSQRLADWVSLQRKSYKKLKENNELSITNEQVKILEDMGFSWIISSKYLRDEKWKVMHEQLKGYLAQEGHCNVPKDYLPNRQLGYWVNSQRRNYNMLRKGDHRTGMTEDRVQLMESIGFNWKADSSKTKIFADWNHNWRVKYEAVKDLFEQEGHLDNAGRCLKNWLRDQKAQYKAFKEGKSSNFTEERLQLCENIGFDMNMRPKVKWEDRFEELKEFWEREGHCKVQQNFNKRLSNWVGDQRRNYKKYVAGKPSALTDRRIHALDEMGFIWQLKAANEVKNTWRDNLKELKQFKSREGRFPSPIEDPQLGTWTSFQMLNLKYFKEGMPSCMTKDRMKDLEEIGFESEGKNDSSEIQPENENSEDAWKIIYDELTQYKNREGHCDVPKIIPKLGIWVHHQRLQYGFFKAGKTSIMTEDRVRLLQEIGFNFRLDDDRWNKGLEELKKLKEQEGHCVVPSASSNTPWLCDWVNEQRVQYKILKEGRPSAMTQPHIQSLEEMGFVWEYDIINNRQVGDDAMGFLWTAEIGDDDNNDIEPGNEAGDHPVINNELLNDGQWYEKSEETKPLQTVGAHEALKGNIGLPTWTDEERQHQKLLEETIPSVLNLDKSNGQGSTWKSDRVSSSGSEIHVKDSLWRKRYDELCIFKAREGNCNIPKKYPPNQPLGYWVNRMRAHYYKWLNGQSSRMTEGRARALVDIGLVLPPEDILPKDTPAAVALALSSTLADVDIASKSAPICGVILKTQVSPPTRFGMRKSWEKSFEELCAFKSQNGNCNVPKKYPDNPSLGFWVNRQRTSYNKWKKGRPGSNMTEERAIVLLQVGLIEGPLPFSIPEDVDRALTSPIATGPVQKNSSPEPQYPPAPLDNALYGEI